MGAAVAICGESEQFRHGDFFKFKSAGVGDIFGGLV